MADVITVTPRKLYLEDLAVTALQAGETASVNVAGAVGNPQTLNKIAVVLYTAYSPYANDAAAAAGGVPVGGHYYNTTTSFMHTRMA
jgi:hypothetical protein